MTAKEWNLLVSAHTTPTPDWERVARAMNPPADLVLEHTVRNYKGTTTNWKEIAHLMEAPDSIIETFTYPVTYWEGVAKAMQPSAEIVERFTIYGTRKLRAPKGREE